VAVPRSEKVECAIFGNVEPLKAAAVRAYPQSKEWFEAGEGNMEYGFNLSQFPDEPIKYADPEVYQRCVRTSAGRPGRRAAAAARPSSHRRRRRRHPRLRVGKGRRESAREGTSSLPRSLSPFTDRCLPSCGVFWAPSPDRSPESLAALRPVRARFREVKTQNNPIAKWMSALTNPVALE
jgi:hypothetical protein